MADTTLAQVLEARKQDAQGHHFAFCENWAQGRTAFGGYTAALLLATARADWPDLPPLRSALINFTGPVSAGPVITSEVLRQGRNVSTIATRAMVEGKVAATGTFSFGAAQDSHVQITCPAPRAASPEDTPHFFPEGLPRLPARFFENFEAKRIEGDLPFMGAERGVMRAWARHRDPASWDKLEGLMAIADLLPPAVFPVCRKPGPNSSMTWICNFLTDQPQTRDGWWHVSTELTAAQNGYSSQVMRIWNTEGELVVEGMQSVIIFM